MNGCVTCESNEVKACQQAVAATERQHLVGSGTLRSRGCIAVDEQDNWQQARIETEFALDELRISEHHFGPNEINIKMQLNSIKQVKQQPLSTKTMQKVQQWTKNSHHLLSHFTANLQQATAENPNSNTNNSTKPGTSVNYLPNSMPTAHSSSHSSHMGGT
ncbi:hypothetical protein TB1_032053 [Malus domestica]